MEKQPCRHAVVYALRSTFYPLPSGFCLLPVGTEYPLSRARWDEADLALLQHETPRGDRLLDSPGRVASYVGGFADTAPSTPQVEALHEHAIHSLVPRLLPLRFFPLTLPLLSRQSDLLFSLFRKGRPWGGTGTLVHCVSPLGLDKLDGSQDMTRIVVCSVLSSPSHTAACYHTKPRRTGGSSRADDRADDSACCCPSQKYAAQTTRQDDRTTARQQPQEPPIGDCEPPMLRQSSKAGFAGIRHGCPAKIELSF